MSWKSIKEGDRIQINAFSHKGQKGYVRYKGEVEGLMGEMLGIELDEPTGKNDGTHNDNRYFECENNHGIFFRAAQVKAIPEDGDSGKSTDDKNKSLKKPSFGLKKPSSAGLKKTPSTSKGGDKEEEKDSARASTKSKGSGLKGPTSSRASGLKKPEGAKTGDTSSRASKISKVKAGSRLGAGKTGLKKPDTGLKKPEDAKSVAQKKEELRNKVKAKRSGLPGAKAKEGDDTRKTGVKKFTRPKKPSETASKASNKSPPKKSKPIETPRSDAKPDEEDIAAEEAMLEATMLSEETKESKEIKEPKKPASKAKPSGLGLKKPGSTTTSKSSASIKKSGKIGGGKTAIKKPAAKKEEPKKPAAKIAKPEAKKITKSASTSKKEEVEKPVPEDDENDEVEDITPPESEEEEEKPEEKEPESAEVDQSEESQKSKKVFKRKVPGEEAKTEGMGGSNLKMLQQAKIEVSKKEAQIQKMSEELKELYEKVKNSDDVHTAEMEIQRLEFERQIDNLKSTQTEQEEAIKTKDQKISELTDRAEQAEANAKDKGGVSISQEKLEEMKKKEEEFQKQIEQKDKEFEELNKELEQYIKDNEAKTEEIESLKIDIETIEVEKTIFKEEKQLMEEEMKQQEEDRLKAMEESMTDDELKYQNEKLRVALRKLTNDIEVERAEWEKAKQELQEQVDRIPELEEKLGDVDVLLEAVEERDEEIEAMKQTVEDATEFQQMVEELTEEIVEKEEIIEELETKINELEEVQAVQEEINANQETFEKEMQNEIAKKDIKIQELENDVQILEEALLEQDDKESKHKQRLNELTEENKLLKEQVSAAYDDKTKNKISDLIEKQRKLQLKLRESTRKEISGSLAEINVGISTTLADLYSSFIPDKLLREGYISNFNKIRLVIYVKNKAHLMYNELCKKKFIESSDFAMGEGQLESYEYFRYMCTLGHNSIRCLNLCQKILHALTFMDAEKYKTICDSPFWQNFVTANSFLDNTIKMVKEDTLTTKVSQNNFEETLDEFDGFYNENVKNPVNEYIKETTSKEEFDIDNAPKNVVKEHILKIGLAVLALGFYMRQRDFYQGKDTDQALQERCKTVFGKMMDSVQAVDEIDQDSHGEEYFKSNINAVKRINDKFVFVSEFWEQDSMAFDQEHKDSEATEETKVTEEVEPNKQEGEGEGEGEKEAEEKQTEESGSPIKASTSSKRSKINYDWYAWLDSVDREITSITSEAPMQELKEKVKEENPSPFLKKMSKGPWITLANNVKEALNQSDAMRDENEKMKEKIKEQSISYVKLKKVKEDLEIIKDTLERKIAALELDTQKLSPLQAEKKRLDDKLAYLNSELSSKDKIINTQKEKLDKMIAEKEKIEKEKTTDRQSTASRRTTGRGSAIGNLLNKQGQPQHSTGVVDESTLMLLDELQQENVGLKRSKLFERITKLSNSSPAFSKFVSGSMLKSDTRDAGRPKLNKMLKLTDEESAGVHNSVNEINGIKQSIRTKMCKAKVFKIGEKTEETKDNSKNYLKESLKNKEGKAKDLNKVRMHLNKINKIMFGGQPEGELGTTFHKFVDDSSVENVEKSSDWKVIGRVKIKPSNSQAKEDQERKERVQKIYLDQFSAHRILKALPTLPSIC